MDDSIGVAEINADDSISEIIPEDVGQDSPVAKRDFSGMSRAEKLDSFYEDAPGEDISDDPDPEPSDEAEAVVEATPVEAKDIPGIEKPVEAKVEPPVDDSEKDVASVEDAPDAGKFRVKGADGKFVETPDVKFEFRVGDKVYTKDSASLVRMAYDGVAGQKAVAQARNFEVDVIPRLKQEAQLRESQLQAELNAQIDLNAAILADESGETWAANHEKFAKSRSPEEVARRAQEELSQVRQQNEVQQAQQYSAQVYATHISPVFERVAQECPDVSDYTKAGFVADLTKDLLVNGRIPPERYPELANRINGPYVEYVRAEQARFSEQKTSTQKAIDAAKAEAARELRAAQTKQNALVAGMKPVGSVSTNGAVSRPTRPAQSRAEALERIMNRPYEG